jgi:hypothetical protein
MTRNKETIRSKNSNNAQQNHHKSEEEKFGYQRHMDQELKAIEKRRN